MNRGELDPAGRSLTQMGWAFGIGGLICMIGPATCIAMLVVGGERIHYTSSSVHVTTTSADGRKLDEGSYRDGKREGQWTFWNADGTIDESRSGIYENDVLMSRRPLGVE
jgi:hypothetical protein